MIYVILLEPVIAGNVGAVARAMMNFGFDKLVLVNPHCDHLGAEARNRAKHAQHILESAEVCEFFIVDDYDYLVGTTAKIGTDYNINRSPLTPAELAEKVKRLDVSKKIGLVMGRENVGLFNEEIERCDFVVTIPSDKEKPTLNLSHATAIILYELHKAIGSADVRSHIKPIGRQEKDQVMRMFKEVFDTLHWETPEKRETQEKLWKRVIGKAMLTNREAYSVMGFLRKVLWKRQGVKNERVVKSKPAGVKAVVVKKSQKGIDNLLPAAKKHLTKGSCAKLSSTRKGGQTSRKGAKAKKPSVKKGKTAPKKKPVKRRKPAKKAKPAVKKSSPPVKTARPAVKKVPAKKGNAGVPRKPSKR